MSIMRSVLLAGAESVWLREKAMRYPFVRRSVARFMPGESMEEALDASRRQERERGTGTILTHLGENLASLSEAEVVTAHYVDLIDRIAAAGLNAQVSVKLTQLGLDLGVDACFSNLDRLVALAGSRGNMLWIDMESTKYVDPTLELFRRARARSARVGVCLQAYLRRTQADLESILPLAPAIRLVKGAYREPPSLAFPGKTDVDENYVRLATRMLQPDVRPGTLLGIGTHDERIIERLRSAIATRGETPAAYEFEMLFGIQRPLQARLVSEKAPLRILISYGEFWFPWYMRRLAERPANVLFVARSLEPTVAIGAWVAAASALGLAFDLPDTTAAGQRSTLPKKIRLRDYPQLKKLAWQLHGVNEISPREALQLYERNWRHVDRPALSEDEAALIDTLSREIGGGRLLV